MFFCIQLYMLKLTERILAKSNSYNYYKNNYKKFLAKNNNLIKENEDLRAAVEALWKRDKTVFEGGCFIL